MKKTILATMLTSLFAATAAHSATVYDANDMALDVYGDVEIQARKGTEKDAHKMINIDDADFGFKVGYDLGNDVTALAVVEVTGESERSTKYELDTADNTINGSSNKSTIDLDDAYVGLSSATWGTVTAGKQVTIADDIGIGNDYEFGISTSSNSLFDGKQVVKYTVDKGNYYGGISYLFNEAAAYDNKNSIDAKLGARFGGLDLTAYYGNTDQGTYDSETVLLEARYVFEALALAATAASTDKYSATADATSFGLAAVFTVDKMAYSAAWSVLDVDNAVGGKENKYFVNAAYAFNSNVTAYVEVAGTDKDDTEMGYAAGMAVSF